jgi:hypothetical protein
MITIQIEDSIRTLSNPRDIDENWANQQINRRRDDRRPVCIRVTIIDDSVNIILASADCTNIAGGDRPPNSKEQSIFDLWERVGMKKKEFHGGNLIAFHKQLRNLI